MTTVHLHGEVDMATLAAFEVTLERGMGTDRDLVLDLSGLTFIDAAGLRLLARADQRMRETGRRLRLQRTNSNVLRLFRLVGIDHLAE
jgi:anti-anti-sigma factor